MKLSTKGRYAARAMMELGAAYGRGPVRLSEIAEKQEISVRYLERMMNAMVTAGLARSTRGQYGGFSLSKPPDQIRLSQVVRAAEGPLTLVECVDDPSTCARGEICVTREIWERLKDEIEHVLCSITLKDMVERQQEKLKSGFKKKNLIS